MMVPAELECDSEWLGRQIVDIEVLMAPSEKRCGVSAGNGVPRNTLVRCASRAATLDWDHSLCIGVHLKLSLIHIC